MARNRMPKAPCSPPHSITTIMDSRLDLPSFTVRFYMAPRHIKVFIQVLGSQSEKAIARRCGVLGQVGE